MKHLAIPVSQCEHRITISVYSVLLLVDLVEVWIHTLSAYIAHNPLGIGEGFG